MQKILLVEDDARLSQMVATFLLSQGFAVDVIDNGNNAVAAIKQQAPDILLLDMMLPGCDGLAILQQVQPLDNTVVIMITAQDDEFTELSALNLGVHDFLAKPLRPHILLAKIKNLTKLTNQSKTDSSTATPMLEVQDVALDCQQRKMLVQDQTVELSDAEFELAEYLMQHAGEIVSREQIIAQIRGIDYDGFDRSIDMRISSLRKKMDDNKPPYKYIKTIRAKGYLFSQ